MKRGEIKEGGDQVRALQILHNRVSHYNRAMEYNRTQLQDL